MKWRVEFSKLVLAAVMATYFIGFGVAACVVMEASEQLGAFLIFVGSATSIAITAYSAKSGAENVAKIRREEPEEHDVAENHVVSRRSNRGL